MADFGPNGFDSNAKENQKQSDCLPAGEYAAVMVASEKKATKSGDGFYLNTQWQICRGEFQNRRFFHKFNLWLPGTTDGQRTAIQISKGQLSELCRAVGVQTPKDSTELHGLPCLVKLNAKDSEMGMQNNVVKFSPLPSGQAPITRPATAESITQAPAQSANASPWGA